MVEAEVKGLVPGPVGKSRDDNNNNNNNNDNDDGNREETPLAEGVAVARAIARSLGGKGEAGWELAQVATDES